MQKKFSDRQAATDLSIEPTVELFLDSLWLIASTPSTIDMLGERHQGAQDSHAGTLFMHGRWVARLSATLSEIKMGE